MYKRLPLSILFLLCVLTTCFGQSRKTKYDSLLVGDRITPAVSSVMMPKSYTEVILYTSLLTANKYFDVGGDISGFSGSGKRESFSFNTLQITRGLSASGRFNVGLDISYRVGRRDADPHSSPLKVFGNSSDKLIKYERAFTSIGFRARYVPFANVPNLVVQHTFYVPINAGSEKSIFLFDHRYALNSQILYNHMLGRKMFLFGQLDFFVRLKEGYQETDYTVPLNIFATYLLTKHLFPFIQIGMSNSWLPDTTSTSFSYGAGLQYQITTMFNLNFFYNDIFAGKNSYQWKSFNLGIRKVF